MKVFLATPSYDGQACAGFEKSLKGTLRLLKKAGIPAQWETFNGCCYLPVSRNKLVKQFLEDSDATDFVFLDSDLEWDPEAFMRMLRIPVDIVGGAYPFKSKEESYPVWLKTENDRPMMGPAGLVEAWTIPTGCMRVRRSAFQAIEAFYGKDALIIEEHSQNNSGELVNTYLNFFDTEKIGRKWWGEDTNFCRRWTMEMQLPIYVFPDMDFVHWGKTMRGQDYPYRGNFHDYLLRRPGGMNDPGYQGNTIEGFMTTRELQWLYLQAKEMESIVEVGSYLGRSAHALLSGCPGSVLCVDPWEGFYWEETESTPGREIYLQFLNNTAQFINRNVMRCRSVDAAAACNGDEFDMVFIDGDHSAKALSEDIDAWMPKTRKLLCGHDYSDCWPDVKKVIDERFGDKATIFDTIWWVEMDEIT